MQISEPAEYVILGLLKKQPMHGYEMFQQFQNSTLGQIVHVEMSQLYAFLKKLEHLAYIEAVEVKMQGVRPPRKIFQLTQQGEDIFLQWLALPVEKPRDIRILFLIKLYFVQRHLPAQTGSLLEQQIDACQRFLSHLEQQHASSTANTSDEAFFDHVVLRSRIYQTRSLLEWMYEMHKEMIGIS
ncbi:MAG TPA: PadR family transcriptional regulator [Ktedonobacteraceae bacterium]|nr:PadR family transcriptional regulator [Ktedonobacteraceae bacterium]